MELNEIKNNHITKQEQIKAEIILYHKKACPKIYWDVMNNLGESHPNVIIKNVSYNDNGGQIVDYTQS